MKEEETSRDPTRGKEITKEAGESRRLLSANDHAIHDILRRVIMKWRAEGASEQEEWTETVVLSSEGNMPKTPSVPLKEESDVLPETVIISPQGTRRSGISTQRQSSSGSPQSPEETVSLQEGKQGMPQKKDGKKLTGQEFLTETVILKPNKEKDKK